MENTEDFVVIDDDSGSEKRSEIDRLRVLVELFTKALDTLNQSNVLLKDELQSALSVTLQHVCPDKTSSTDDLIKLLDSNVSSPEEVRANYVKRLCSRLVALNEEKMALLAENTSLRESITSKELEFSEQVADANLTTRNIEMVLAQLENDGTNPPDIISAGTTIGDLCTSLNGIYDRLVKLQLTPSTKGGITGLGDCLGATRETMTAPRTMVSVGVLASEEQMNSLRTPKHTATILSPPLPTPVQVPSRDVHAVLQDLPPPPAYPDRTSMEGSERINPQAQHVEENDDFSEFGLSTPQDQVDANELFVPVVVENERAEGAGRGTPQPSYSANQEDPWCPCCHQRFGSRDELETHLLSCLS